RSAVGGEGVEEHVGRRVIALPGVAEDARRRGVQDEGVDVAGQLVQVPGRDRLGGQHLLQPLGGQRLHDAVVQRTCAVDHGRQRPSLQILCQGVTVGCVAGGDLHLCSQFLQLCPEFGRARRCLASSAEQQQSACAVGL